MTREQGVSRNLKRRRVDASSDSQQAITCAKTDTCLTTRRRPPALLRLLCPELCAGRVIGKGGSVLAQIRGESGVKVHLAQSSKQQRTRAITVSLDTGPSLQESDCRRSVGGAVHAVAALHACMHVKPSSSDSEAMLQLDPSQARILGQQQAEMLWKLRCRKDRVHIMSDCTSDDQDQLNTGGVLVRVTGHYEEVQDILRAVTQLLQKAAAAPPTQTARDVSTDTSDRHGKQESWEAARNFSTTGSCQDGRASQQSFAPRKQQWQSGQDCSNWAVREAAHADNTSRGWDRRSWQPGFDRDIAEYEGPYGATGRMQNARNPRSHVHDVCHRVQNTQHCHAYHRHAGLTYGQ